MVYFAANKDISRSFVKAAKPIEFSAALQVDDYETVKQRVLDLLTERADEQLSLWAKKARLKEINDFKEGKIASLTLGPKDTHYISENSTTHQLEAGGLECMTERATTIR